MTHSVPQRFRRFQNLQPVDRTRVTEVKDRLGNLVYRWANKKGLGLTHQDSENPPVDFVPTVLAAVGRLLQAGWRNLQNQSQREVFTVQMDHQVISQMKSLSFTMYM